MLVLREVLSCYYTYNHDSTRLFTCEEKRILDPYSCIKNTYYRKKL